MVAGDSDVGGAVLLVIAGASVVVGVAMVGDDDDPEHATRPTSKAGHHRPRRRSRITHHAPSLAVQRLGTYSRQGVGDVLDRPGAKTRTMCRWWMRLGWSMRSVPVGRPGFDAGDRVVQLWRYSWGHGHVRGIDVFRVANGLVAEKLSYVEG